jgi:hypothetical protein
MPSKYQLFDRTRLKLKPISEREHEVSIRESLDVEEDNGPAFNHDDLALVAERLHQARKDGAARVLLLGAHVLRAGVSSHVIDMMEQGFVTHVAMNGAAAIHDYELARIGATNERVERYVRSGEFGLWRETGEFNRLVCEAKDQSLGLGENLGRAIYRSDFPYRQLSILTAAYRLSIPATVHIGIGFDITHEHPNCDGAAYGEASYRDFLIFAHSLEKLEGGVLVNFGSAVMGPQIYLKALAMVRNVAHQEGRTITKFTTAIFDVWPIRGDFQREAEAEEPSYYFQPHRTVLIRTVADGGKGFYFQGDHRATLPALRRTLFEGAAELSTEA